MVGEEHHTKHRFRHLKRSLYDQGDDTFPKLSGSAATTRALGKPLRTVFNRLVQRCPDAGRMMVHRQIDLLLLKSAQMEEIIDAHKNTYVWPRQVAKQYLKITFDYLSLQQSVHNWFSGQRPCIALFHITVKSHMLVHGALYNFAINPSLVWNYMGEDFMKKIKKLAAQNAVATNWLSVNQKVVQQYVHGMDFFLRDANFEYFR